METEFSERSSLPKLGLPESINGTGEPLCLIQTHSSEFSSPSLEKSTGLVPYNAEVTPQDSLPKLSSAEKWDLEGYLQLAYSLATASLFESQIEPSLWDTYSTSLVEAFYEALDDPDSFFTDIGLGAAFENCTEIFAVFNQWPQQTKDDIFSGQASGKEALGALLQLVKLAKGFGIEGESWWELRRELRIGFIETFKQHGWVSPECDIFQKIFRNGLNVFFNVGVQQGSWTYTVIRELSEWRQAKETQELIAAENSTITLTLKETMIDGGNQSVIKESFVNTPFLGYTFETDFGAQLSPGSRLREHERRKPLLNLQLRLAPSFTSPSPSLLRQTPSPSRLQASPSDTQNYISSPQTSIIPPHPRIGNSLPADQLHRPSVFVPQDLYIVASPSKTPKALRTESEDSVNICLSEFGEFMDIDPLCLPSENEPQQFPLSGETLLNDIETAMQTEEIGNYMASNNTVAAKGLEDTESQLWQISDEDFREFCGASST